MDNVLTAVQEVDWRTLGKVLLPLELLRGEFSYPTLDKIGEQYLSDDDRLRAVVETWVQGDGWDKKPSWRQFIWTLDWGEMTGVADNVRRFAESVLGKSCDSIIALFTMYTSFLT